MSFFAREAFTPLELEAKLIDLASKDPQAFQQFLHASKTYRDEYNQQRQLFYYKRNFWEYGVKLSVATLGTASLALGAAATPVLLISAIALMVNFLSIEYIAELNTLPFRFETTEELPTHCSAPIFWQKSCRKHHIRLDNNYKQYNLSKLGVGMVLSYAVFMLIAPQLSFSLVVAASLFLTALLAEASQAPQLYVEAEQQGNLSTVLDNTLC